MSFRLVIFDFDGTLTAPSALDFSLIRKALRCPPNKPVLEFIDELPDGERTQAAKTLLRFEMDAAARSVPNPGAEELVLRLKSWGLRLVIITRNESAPVARAFKNFRHTTMDDFDLIISRDAPHKPKPHPASVIFALESLDVHPHEALMVGDYVFDIQAGIAAGTATAYLDTGRHVFPSDVHCDHVIGSLSELEPIIRSRLPLPLGKFPNELLASMLMNINRTTHPTVLTPPRVGEDTAAIDVADDEVIVMKSDPITFETSDPGRHSVIINANDIATAGATPRWMLVTLLAPPGTTPESISRVMENLHRQCQALEIAVCGGHTEITDAVSRLVVSASLVGVVSKDKLARKTNMTRGDAVLMTKRVAVEGTAIILSEHADRLREVGIAETSIRKSAEFTDKLSVIPEARAACETGAVTAMHDVTEGGFATALRELATAGGRDIQIDMDAIAYYPETLETCERLNLDPLGLIGSGTLLICCQANHSERVLTVIREAGVEACEIGEVGAEGGAIIGLKRGNPVEWPSFKTDELTKLSPNG